jgi:hypothetical protein
MRLRFSIASLLAAIIFCGISLAALRSAFTLWASVMFRDRRGRGAIIP